MEHWIVAVEGVDVALSDGTTLRAEYLVGCDGGRSLIRKRAGIEFPGWDATTSWLIAETSMAEEPKWGSHEDGIGIGIHAIGKAETAGSVRAVLTEQHLQLGGGLSLHEVSDALVAV